MEIMHLGYSWHVQSSINDNSYYYTCFFFLNILSSFKGKGKPLENNMVERTVPWILNKKSRIQILAPRFTMLQHSFPPPPGFLAWDLSSQQETNYIVSPIKGRDTLNDWTTQEFP